MPEAARQHLTPNPVPSSPTRRLSLAQRLLIASVVGYRITLGRLLGGQCRFHPTCSQYAIDAVTRHGALRGGWQAACRIARCHPWGGSGYDPA